MEKVLCRCCCDCLRVKSENLKIVMEIKSMSLYITSKLHWINHIQNDKLTQLKH